MDDRGCIPHRRVLSESGIDVQQDAVSVVAGRFLAYGLNAEIGRLLLGRGEPPTHAPLAPDLRHSEPDPGRAGKTVVEGREAVAQLRCETVVEWCVVVAREAVERSAAQ